VKDMKKKRLAHDANSGGWPRSFEWELLRHEHTGNFYITRAREFPDGPVSVGIFGPIPRHLIMNTAGDIYPNWRHVHAHRNKEKFLYDWHMQQRHKGLLVVIDVRFGRPADLRYFLEWEAARKA